MEKMKKASFYIIICILLLLHFPNSAFANGDGNIIDSSTESSINSVSSDTLMVEEAEQFQLQEENRHSVSNQDLSVDKSLKRVELEVSETKEENIGVNETPIVMKDVGEVNSRISSDGNEVANQPTNDSLVDLPVQKSTTIEVTSTEQLSFAVNSDVDYRGIALKNPTNVYSSTNDLKVLKSYQAGSILKYQSYSKGWYKATVYISGKKKTGYIRVSDVQNLNKGAQEHLKGIGLRSPTKVYSKASTNSKALKTYVQGSILQYRTLSQDWYEATVYISGKKKTGYIKVSDVQNLNKGTQDHLKGIGLIGPTKVYSKASTSSKALKTYAQGSILQYKTLSKDWYEATVYISGKKKTGYIKVSDVQNLNKGVLEQLKGIGLRSPTKVYSKASTNSKSLKSYAKGSILQYRTLSKGWHEATVYINGKKKTGYINVSDVENGDSSPKGLDVRADINKVNVYSNASTQGKVLKTYSKNRILIVRTFTKDWYEATVYVGGKPKTGYIKKSDTSTDLKRDIKYTSYNLSLDEALAMQEKVAPQTDKKYRTYVSKDYIQNGKVIVKDGSSLNVRGGPGTSYWRVGTLKNGETVTILGEKNGWYEIKFAEKWVNANPTDVKYYLNPNNFKNSAIQQLQFLDLTKTTGVSESLLNNYLKGKGTLEGQGKAFIDASKKYGINEIYLVSHAVLETGSGTSELAKGIEFKGTTVFNMYGIGAKDSCPLECGARTAYEKGWDTPYKAIVEGAAFIGNSYIRVGQNTLYKMRWNPDNMVKGRVGHQYASDIGWAYKQAKIMYNNFYYDPKLYSLLYLDIPVYK